MGRSIDSECDTAASPGFDRHGPREPVDGGQVVLDDLRECLIGHVEVEIVVLRAVIVVTGQLVVMARAIGEVNRSRRLLPVETVMDVAMRVREPREEEPERRQPRPAFRDHAARIAAPGSTGYPCPRQL